MNGRWDEIMPRLVHDAKALLRGPALKTQLLRRKTVETDPAFAEALDAVIEGHKNLELFFNRVSALQEAMRAGSAAPRSAQAAIASARLGTKPMIDAAGGTWTLHRADACAITAPLDKVLIELIDNSARFRRAETPPEMCVEATAGPDALCVTYTDNSIGWDPEYTDKIFRPFETLDPARSGFGLGLAIAAAIVERNGGGIRARPDADGCRFEIELPLA